MSSLDRLPTYFLARQNPEGIVGSERETNSKTEALREGGILWKDE